MGDLLQKALAAHGGLDRWNSFGALEANVTVGGAVWEAKKKDNLVRSLLIAMRTHAQEVVTTPFGGANRQLRFRPERCTFETLDGVLIAARDDPRSAFAGHDPQSPWDDFHAGYFNSYALWTYLTQPFLYTYPGVTSEEIDPWDEGGDRWRRLKVRFPTSIATHTHEQVSYFGEDGLLRRHDYAVDVMGGAIGANYAAEYRRFGGIVVPTMRRIHPTDVEGRAVLDTQLITIDFANVVLRRGE